LDSSQYFFNSKGDPPVFSSGGLFQLRHVTPKGFTLTNDGFTGAYEKSPF